jgi:hypothetical protein
MMEKVSRFIGAVVGNLLTERALALWIFAGHPEIALVWSVVKAVA